MTTVMSKEKTESYKILSYREGDENHILSLFNSVFLQSRTIKHWKWKFENNHYGRHKIMLCWYNNELIAQYAGYPVTMEWHGKSINTVHLGDIMTHPDYRSNVMGRKGLLVRTANAFFDEFGGEDNGKALIMYGTVTGRHLKLGELLLKYTSLNVATQLGKEIANRVSGKPSISSSLVYSIQSSTTVPHDVDYLWKICRKGMGLETIRNYEYLKWRYEECPDTDYTFWTLRNRLTKNLQCLIVTRERQGIGCLVDFLCVPKGNAVSFILDSIEQSFLKKGIEKIELWAPEYHPLFIAFQKQGYRLENEPNSLFITARSFSPNLDITTLRTNFFYTMGDSDLF